MGVIFLSILVPYFFVFLCWSCPAQAHCYGDRPASLLDESGGFRAIKTHAWEDKFREEIKTIRR